MNYFFDLLWQTLFLGFVIGFSVGVVFGHMANRWSERFTNWLFKREG